jgi:hypothetical protein
VVRADFPREGGAYKEEASCSIVYTVNTNEHSAKRLYI